MAGLPDEDVPTMSSVELKAAVAAELGAASAVPDTEEDEDERTVQAVAPSSTMTPAVAPTPGPPRPGPPRPAAPRPGSSSNVAAKPARPPSRPDPSANKPDEEPEEIEDSITATAPRVPSTPLGLGIPGKVEIRTMNSDDLVDETEVATLTASGELLRAVAERAAAEPAVSSPAPDDDDDDDGPTRQASAPMLAETPQAGSPVADDDDDDGDTTQAVAPRVGSAPDLVRISSKSLIDDGGEVPTRTGVGSGSTLTGDLPTKPGVSGRAHEYEPEDSVTSRSPAVDDYADDSVTTQAPLGTAALEALVTNDIPTVDRRPSGDDTDATTHKKSRPPASPADGEPASVTAQAPNLTNMLRVIASDRPSAIEPDDEDQLPENKTAVMAQAPLKQPGTLLGMGPVAVPPRAQPASESAMRIAAAEPMPGDKASLGAIFGADPRHEPTYSDGGLRAAGVEPPFPPPPLLLEHESLEVVPRGPRYGVLVAVVAVISVVVPVSLYFYLSRSGDELGPPRPIAHVVPDFVRRDEAVRQKAPPKGGANAKKPPLRR